MNTLSKENIQFIDQYLDNSEVVYADIRMEMVDHVASEIEERIHSGDQRDFYYVFKDYMIENKSRLLNNNKQFIKQADKKIYKTLLLYFFSLKGLVLFALLMGLFFVAFKFLKIDSFINLLTAVPFIALLLFAIAYALVRKVYKAQRFSVIERLALPFVILFHAFSFINNFTTLVERDPTTLIYCIIFVSLVLTLLVLLYRITIVTAKSYRNTYKLLS